MTVIALYRLLIYLNHELSLENKTWKMIPYEFMVRGKSCFLETDSYLFYVVVSYIKVLYIEGPNHFIFYKKKQACDLFFGWSTLTILILLITFHCW